jgi:uncharacterized ubiquitin-like protein YukD
MTVLYTSITLDNTTYYAEKFDYNLGVALANNRTLANNANFMQNRSLLRVQIESSNIAITEVQDIFSAQKCLDNAKYLIDNPNLFN